MLQIMAGPLGQSVDDHQKMNQTSFANLLLLNPSSPNFLLPLLLLPLGFYVLFRHIRSNSSSKRKPLPPGPKPWPIIGNILHMGKSPHLSLTNFAKIHGPLISLRLGTQLFVVGSSPQAAIEILKNHDRLLSGRHIPKIANRERYAFDRVALVWSPECSSNWKWFRGLCRTELFSVKALQSHATAREKKVGEMVEFLAGREGKVVNVGEAVFNAVFNTLSNLIFSKDLASFEAKDVTEGGLKSHISKMMVLTSTPNIADFYPILEGLDPQGLKRKLAKCHEEMFAVWEGDIKERREKHGHGASSNNRDFLDVFVANGFDDDQICWLSMELFIAGTDTTTTTIEWTMAELLKNKEIMKKLCQELEREIGRDAINEARISQLPYLNACVKETFRLHPPVPLLVPHRALEDCEVMNCTIPKDSQVVVNLWAIGRDPSVWVDPLSFKPERFLGSNLDFKGQDFEFLPFGSGRRICPGLPLATKQVYLIVASLIHYFDWSLPNREDLADLDMSERFGITLQKKKPLLFVPNKRL